MYIKKLIEKDQFNTAPAPKFVGITFEGNCNLNCKHCYWTGYDNKLHVSDNAPNWEGRLSEIISWDSDVFYAGRILTRKGANFLQSYCERSGKSVGIIDNGFTILKFPELFKSYSFVNISIDGARKDHDIQRNHVGAAEVAWNAVRELRQEQLDLVISSCISPLNMKGWEEFEDEVCEFGVPLSVTPVMETRLNSNNIPLFDKTIIRGVFDTLLNGCTKHVKLHDLEHVKSLLPTLKEFEWVIENDCISTNINGIYLTWTPYSIFNLLEINLSWDGDFYTVHDAGNTNWTKISDKRRLEVSNNYASQEAEVLRILLA